MPPLARDFGPAEAVEPLYLRVPDAIERDRDATAKVELRRLELRDLNEIERIERDSYPTPWSRSMFAGELAKPTSLSLGAFDPESAALVGYLIISRYVDAWHVMNVAVDPDHRRRGIAATLLERLFELTAGGRAPRLHARGARLERRRDPPLRAARVPARAASGAATTRTTARTP